ELQDAAAGEGHVGADGAARHLKGAAADGGRRRGAAGHEVVEAAAIDGHAVRRGAGLHDLFAGTDDGAAGDRAVVVLGAAADGAAAVDAEHRLKPAAADDG